MPESDYPVIYLILPTLLYSIDNFEVSIKLIILEIIDFTLKRYITQSLPSIENIIQYIIKELENINKFFKTSHDKEIKYMYLSILDNLCTSYTEEISEYYQKIIILILSLLPEKEEISIESKRKIISCLRHIGDSLSNYMSIVIPKLTNYLMSLINKMKLISYKKNSKNLVNNIDAMEEDVISYDSLDIEDLNAVLAPAPYVSDKIDLHLRELWAEFFRLIGVANLQEQKRERVIIDEMIAQNKIVVPAIKGAERGSLVYVSCASTALARK